MSSHLVFNGLDDDLEARLEAYWQKKWPRLERVLAPYRPEVQDVRVTFFLHKKPSRKERYEVRAVIHLPTGTLAAEEENADAFAALDLAVDRLVAEIKRHKERVRKDYVFRRKNRQRADLDAAGAMLQRDVKGGRREDFFQLLRPQLRVLRPYAQRELRVLELKGALHRGEVEVDDVLDDVLVRAWERFSRRPKNQPLHLWLTGLLHEAIEGHVEEEPRPHESLEKEVEQADEKEWWTELLGEKENFTLADLLPDEAGNGALDELEAQEQRDRIMTVLGDVPAAQRQAFLLHALEGYDVAEIAMLQDRPEEQVRQDVEAVRQTLKERLLGGEPAAAVAAAEGKV